MVRAFQSPSCQEEGVVAEEEGEEGEGEDGEDHAYA